MTKKTVLLLCAGGVLITLVLALVLIFADRQPTPRFPQETGGTTALSDTTAQTQPDTGEGEQTDVTLTYAEGVELWEEEATTGTTVPAPTQTTLAPTDATESTGSADSTDSTAEPGSLSYEQYLALSTGDKQKYYESFGDPADFFAWLTQAQAQYEATTESITGNGTIDIGQLMTSVPTGG